MPLPQQNSSFITAARLSLLGNQLQPSLARFNPSHLSALRGSLLSSPSPSGSLRIAPPTSNVSLSSKPSPPRHPSAKPSGTFKSAISKSPPQPAVCDKELSEPNIPGQVTMQQPTMESPFGSHPGHPSECCHLDLEFLNAGTQNGLQHAILPPSHAVPPGYSDSPGAIFPSQLPATHHSSPPHHQTYNQTRQQPQFSNVPVPKNQHLYNLMITHNHHHHQSIQPPQIISPQFHVPIPTVQPPLAAHRHQRVPQHQNLPTPLASDALAAACHQCLPAPPEPAPLPHQQLCLPTTQPTEQSIQPLPSFQQLTQDAKSALAKAQEEQSGKGGHKKAPRKKRKRALPSSPAPTATQSQQPPNRVTTTTGAPEGNGLPAPLAFNEPPPAEPLPRGLKHTPASCVRLEEDIVAQYCLLPLDELRRLAAEHAENSCLCAEDHIELNALYDNYQREIYIMAIKNKLFIDPVLDHLGLATRIKGSTCYNNFCQYNPEASQINADKLKSSQLRAHEMGILWQKQSDKDRWYNLDFLDSLPNPDEASAKQAQEEAKASTRKKKKSYVNMKPDQWANKVINDLKKLSSAYGVKGLLLFASRDKNQTTITSGGSIMGVQFLDMFPEEMDLRTNFVDYVKGQKAIVKVTGSLPPPPKKPRKQCTGKKNLLDEKYAKYNKGKKTNKLAELRPLIVGEINKVSNRRWKVLSGWPGTHTISALAKVGVKMKVKENKLKIVPKDFCHQLDRLRNGELHRLLVAVGKGWFKLDPIESESVDVEDEAHVEVDLEGANTLPQVPWASGVSQTADKPVDKRTKGKNEHSKIRPRPNNPKNKPNQTARSS
ncbi:hypothetical protein PCASD_07138 [Puccinia coronata f. sp. avenae]|uniref:Uncharacterized protein n=1 Tax=Puccinia coronata f. sp. avenae TaxID=200324 RepID=A0A2N5V4A0_9BASI|nr:hypothetical protein PCASD_07138 [Puccinia coronata f. sp. avenae]